MNGKNIKVWLVSHDTTQKQLADTLGLSAKTMNTYCNGVAPKWMQYALIGLSIELSEG